MLQFFSLISDGVGSVRCKIGVKINTHGTLHWGIFVSEKMILFKRNRENIVKKSKKNDKNPRIMGCPIFAKVPTPLLVPVCLILINPLNPPNNPI